MKHRNDSHSPGPVIRELVPSSHQRSELSNTIVCIFSGWDQRIGEGIPIPDSLGEEATFINICIGNGSLKCHRVLIPTTPSFGDKVICWYTGFTCTLQWTFRGSYSCIFWQCFLIYRFDPTDLLSAAHHFTLSVGSSIQTVKECVKRSKVRYSKPRASMTDALEAMI